MWFPFIGGGLGLVALTFYLCEALRMTEAIEMNAVGNHWYFGGGC